MPEPDQNSELSSPFVVNPDTITLRVGPDAPPIPVLSLNLVTRRTGATAPGLDAGGDAMRYALAALAAVPQGLDLSPMMRAFQNLTPSLAIAGESLLSSPRVRRAAYEDGFIVADADGRFRVGGADDDIDWLREFWAFRHGEDHVSPVFGTRHRRFLFRPERIERAARLRWLWAEAERHFGGAVL